MKTLTLTAMAALLLATPVLAQTPAAGDGEIRTVLEWQTIVAKADANRAGTKVEDVAATTTTTATDAAQARKTTPPTFLLPHN